MSLQFLVQRVGYPSEVFAWRLSNQQKVSVVEKPQDLWGRWLVTLWVPYKNSPYKNYVTFALCLFSILWWLVIESIFFILSFFTGLSYSQASANCQALKSELAQPTNDLESDTLTNVLATSSINPDDSFWIGNVGTLTWNYLITWNLVHFLVHLKDLFCFEIVKYLEFVWLGIIQLCLSCLKLIKYWYNLTVLCIFTALKKYNFFRYRI